MRLQLRPLSIVALVLCVTACAQPPTEDINAADQAVKEAQQSGAAAYLPDENAKLEATMAAIQREVSEQQSKFALFRDYGKVDQMAAIAKSEASRVKTESARIMEDAKTAAVQAHHDAQDSVNRTMDLVMKAPTGKDRAALESIKADADALKASANDVQMMIDKGDYLTAQTKAKAVREKSQAVSAEIESALAKIGKVKASSPKRKVK
ncbi:conserved exported protein of unknown function [Nitrospira sp. KM1]|uniref:hypothetical protein n=1 Tax=Nitrospira sp. KM1 TaxID=1936990 RepID=UPI0013A7AB6F|nr:hypothetical protein [Nitrospira sp. KM1]BCA55479.1 conserved exported protein of unknown function [Nitrospira sp. KM1]